MSRAEANRRRRNRRRAAVVLLAALLSVAGFRLVKGLSRSAPLARLFAVRRIVSDCPFMNLEDLKGRNILAIELSALAERLRSENPLVREVEIRKVMPDTLVFSTVRRVPFAWLRGRGRKRVIVDREGVALPLEVSEEEFLPLVELVGFPEEGFSDALEEFSALADLFSFLETRAAYYGHGFFSLETASAARVLVPRDAGPDRADLLRRILADFARKGVTYTYVDLRFEQPVFMPGRDALPLLREGLS